MDRLRDTLERLTELKTQAGECSDTLAEVFTTITGGKDYWGGDEVTDRLLRAHVMAERIRDMFDGEEFSDTEYGPDDIVALERRVAEVAQ